MKSELVLRPAKEEDQPRIKKLVRSAHLNPFGLYWNRFVVVENPTGKFIGCAQIKTHQDGSKELASLVVEPNYRGKGVAKMIIEHLLKVYSGDLFLMCHGSLGNFYEKFGFKIAHPDGMSPYFRRIDRIVTFFQGLTTKPRSLLVMRHIGSEQ